MISDEKFRDIIDKAHDDHPIICSELYSVQFYTSTDGPCTLITFADVLGTYPKEKLAAIELLERTRK
jgi:hypothetical protein